MSEFEPIAIVGRGSILPQAATPAALFELVTLGKIALTHAPAGRWGVDPESLLHGPHAGVLGAPVACDIGGYVADSEVANARRSGRALLPQLDQLDPAVAWLLSCARAALAEAGRERAPERSALIVGQLSYPSSAMTEFVEAYWLSKVEARAQSELARLDARNRFCSGLPIHLVARALGIQGAAFAIDAACSSALYALKLGCDRLHDGTTDLVLAGGMARADDLFLHLGFTALSALSPSGRSRPFHAAADGLVPAEGAALVALERLSDALARGARILGVIRGIGLSNDGRQNGFLAPSALGQLVALRAAYEQAGLSPEDIAYVECHATGTLRGDATELESLSALWTGPKKPALGSLKSNIGHTMTASGAASLIKVLAAFEAELLPPSVCDAPVAAATEAGFRVLTAPSPWICAGPRRAAISNFGFGGNNAHLIVEEWTADAPAQRRVRPGSGAARERVVIVAIGVLAGKIRGYPAFARRLMSPRGACDGRMTEIALGLTGLGFPPNDLRASLAQQTAVLAVAAEALARVPPLPRDRTGVFIGMGCDTLVARHGLRFKLARLLGLHDDHPELSEWRARNEGSAPTLTAAGVLGTMPNLPANRVHAARDFCGFGFTVSNEELSGLSALDTAVRALASGELDAALVGAVDFSCEPAHEHAARLLPEDRRTAGDAAVAFVLMRETDAARAGLPSLARAGEPAHEPADLALAPDSGTSEVTHRFGHAHAASGLLHVAAAIALTGARAYVDAHGAWPLANQRAATTVHVESFSGQRARVSLAVPVGPVALPFPVPRVRTYAAADRRALLECITTDSRAERGQVRLALLADDEASLDSLRAAAADALRAGNDPTGPGRYFGAGEVEGELAFTFTGAAAGSPGAGRELLLGFPELGEAIARRFTGAEALSRALYGAHIERFTPLAQLTASAFVSQAHAELSLGLLGMRPSAAIGLSSGESNALLAFGVWRDFDAMLAEIDRSGLYQHELAGECRAASRHFQLDPGASVAWRCFRVTLPVAEVRAAIAPEPRCYLTIIQGPDDCVIGGEAAAVERVLDRLGRNRAIDLGLDMVVHCAALEPFAEQWRTIHTRETFPARGVRFYTSAGNAAYSPTRQAAAAALTQQAIETIDFPRTIERAYADGVRVFVEHGPRAILSGAISRVLEGRPHLAVALDRRDRNGGLGAAADAVLTLWAAGVALELGPFSERLRALAPSPDEALEPRALTLPAHWPAIVFPARHAAAPPAPDVQRMAPPEDAPRYDLMPLFNPSPRATGAIVETGRAHAVVELFSQVARVHRDFVTQQQALQAQFLALRRPAAPSSARLSAGPERSEPRFSRHDLLAHASGRISDLFGPAFASQDGYARRVRMPEPPLLLADRVTSLEGEAGSMGRGRVVTETDVRDGAWYLHHGRMAPGALIEAGQADLFLISWLGADFTNRSERVYRLLGCELTFHGGMPHAGETLRYEIQVDGHANTGDVRLFFFHYDCYAGQRLLLSVREGSAGFFSAAELANSGGVLWDAETDAPEAGARVDPPPCASQKHRFSRADLAAFRAGDAFSCFGAGFERAAAHQRTPNLPSGRLSLIDQVTAFEPRGGPWRRGYLRASAHVPKNAWFYEGHFKNDPCMPGTLLADAATQALAFAMAALGFTIERDGYRFEPVAEVPAKFVCRGQVIPDRAHELEYEVFIESVIDGPEPALFAALLCTSDGVKVFACRRFGLRLVPDWPLATRPEWLAELPAAREVGPHGGVRGDEAALIACAWGQPSVAFGAPYAKFDGARRAPRLPGPPYHFLTRVVSVEGAPNLPVQGASVVSEYDVPEDAWYFGAGGAPMPLAVLLEILLQPCGWLTSYLGFAVRRETDVLLRNLDGERAVLTREVTPRTGRLVVNARLERFAEAAGSSIVFFDVRCSDDRGLVMSLKTDFGCFEPAVLDAQVGLPVTAEVRARVTEPSPTATFPLDPGPPALTRASPGERLHLIDEITGYWPASGSSSARIRGRYQVDPAAWYFKAHFFQDPVQPGSLGLQALVHLARCLLLLARPEFAGAAFETIALGEPFEWRFRGQATPENREIVSEVEAIELLDEPRDVRLRARGKLWVDGLCVYELSPFAVRARLA